MSDFRRGPTRRKPRRPPVSTLPQPRQRTRSFDWWDERERAETVKCPPYPRGCAAPIGQTCRNRVGDELVNQPAHAIRSQLAAQAEPDAAGDPTPADPEGHPE